MPDLAELLRELRRRDARERRSAPFTYRELASKTGWSFTVISDYFAGRVLPPTDRFDDLIRLLGATPAEQGALATARDRVEELRRRGNAALGKRAHPRPTVPRQLPAAVRHFTGREDELAVLDGVAARAAQTGGTVLISAIAGTAGVGKTTLAIHWAHRVRDRFPDGQLHVNLRGFDPGGRIVPPADALLGFLTALGVMPQAVPAGLDDRAALYRSLVADKRILVVLDNARDAEQVRPLLPGTAGCVAVVTSRNLLSGLVAVEGAEPLALDLLSAGESRELLSRRLGQDRTGAEPEAVDRIAAACARLPLALAIVAAHAGLHPTLPLRSVADQLSGMRDRLDAFTGQDPSSDARAVFSWSYHALDPAAARLFRLLGLHPGPDVSISAAASLAALPVDQTSEALFALAAAHLTSEPNRGRYVLHDLLRAYAAELSRTEDSNVERSAAVDRMLDHYLHTAHGIALMLNPSRPPIALSAVAPGAKVETLTDPKQGLAWLATEHQVLVGSVELAAGAGQDFRAWALAWSIVEYLDRHGHWPVYARTQEIAQEAAKRLADPAALAYSHRCLSSACIRLGRYDQALDQLRQALAVSTTLGDSLGQAAAHLDLSFAHNAQRRHADALRESQRALDLFRTLGRRRGEARALNAIGWCHTQLGDHEQAVVHCENALAVLRELDDRHGLGLTYDSLGYAHHQLGDHSRSAACFQEAIGLFADLGDRYDQADSMTRLGDVWRAKGDYDAARDLYEQALAILVELGHPNAAHVRDRLG
ncbi:hypothetical protein Rhe02_63320 [Rhizocola hellebori]|uniref:HTH cro/C1-type domain-containing protein n=1 Tax=Rhizocola hellebori TaxID=1392758 RepID=A0A8J3QCT9_9ACTN|nr:hypothetical protein Rhe02_63320 [Rhizocola hellebori]